jgi:hypothetical protein
MLERRDPGGDGRLSGGRKVGHEGAAIGADYAARWITIAPQSGSAQERR